MGTCWLCGKESTPVIWEDLRPEMDLVELICFKCMSTYGAAGGYEAELLARYLETEIREGRAQPRKEPSDSDLQ